MRDRRVRRTTRWRLAWPAGIVIALTVVVAGPAAAKSSTASVTFSGAVTGTSSGGSVSCFESEGLKGKQFALTLGSFTADAKKYTLSTALIGTNYAAGTFDLSEPTGSGVFMQLAADTGGQRWYSGARSGTITLAKDKKSGSFEGDLTPPGGGSPVHVKGSWKCTKVQKFKAATGPNSTTLTTKGGTEQIVYDGTSKLLSSDTNCHSTTEFTLTIRNGAKYAGKTAVVMFYGLDYPTKPTKSFPVGPDGSIPVTFEAFSCSRGGVGEQQGVALVSVDANPNVFPPPSVVAGS